MCIYMHIHIYGGDGLVAKSGPILATPHGSSVHGILQARTLELVAIPFSYTCMYVCMYIYVHTYIYIMYSVGV